MSQSVSLPILFHFLDVCILFQFNMVVLVLMVVSFVHPVYMWRRCRADRRAFQAEEAGQPLKTSDAKL